MNFDQLNAEKLAEQEGGMTVAKIRFIAEVVMGWSYPCARATGEPGVWRQFDPFLHWEDAMRVQYKVLTGPEADKYLRRMDNLEFATPEQRMNAVLEAYGY